MLWDSQQTSETTDSTELYIYYVFPILKARAGSVYSIDTPDKEMSHIQVGQGKMEKDFVTLLKTAHNLKLMNCLFVKPPI